MVNFDESYIFMFVCALLPLLAFERGFNLVAFNIETIADSLIQQPFFLVPMHSENLGNSNIGGQD